jgi:hypothetical protein
VKFIESYDDIDYARDKTKTPADHVGVPLTWKNKSVKLDLSDKNYRMLDELLGDVVKAAEPVVAKTPAGRKSVAHGGRRSNEYYTGLRGWVDRNRISKKDGSGRPAYEGINGKNDYPEWLIADYDAYLAKQPAEPAA